MSSAGKRTDPNLEPPARGRILLHSCCAPCSAAIIERLSKDGAEFSVFYFNPNIFPREEYELRKSENKKLAESFGVEFIDADWTHGEWLAECGALAGEPERGARCLECFKLRLLKTRRFPQLYPRRAGRTSNRCSKPARSPRKPPVAPSSGRATGAGAGLANAAHSYCASAASTTSNTAGANSPRKLPQKSARSRLALPPPKNRKNRRSPHRNIQKSGHRPHVIGGRCSDLKSAAGGKILPPAAAAIQTRKPP